MYDDDKRFSNFFGFADNFALNHCEKAFLLQYFIVKKLLSL